MEHRREDLRARDAKVLWHPATHFADDELCPVVPIRSAQGSWLVDEAGRPILDAVSSWWTSVHGHAHPTIVEAVREQVGRLDHVMFAGFTHAPAIELAEQLLAVAPDGFGRVYFADCGSAAVEVAMKMSWHSRILRGQNSRRRFATLRNGYHGETLGALSACGIPPFREPFQALLLDALQLPCPPGRRHEPSDLDRRVDAGASETEEALRLLEEHAEELTAVIVEPLVQCAGRMAMPGLNFHERLVERARALGIHVIADEIAVGFGRTGKLFASQWSAHRPDLLCLGKALSGGILPLACVLVEVGFEDVFRGDPSRSFLHSHTFAGNPIACAAALASLRVFRDEETLEHLPRRIATMARLRRELAETHAAVKDHRQCGLVAALELEAGSKMPEGGRLGLALRRAALARGVLLRPLHDTVYWMPPLNVRDDELQRVAEVTGEVIAEVLE